MDIYVFSVRARNARIHLFLFGLSVDPTLLHALFQMTPPSSRPARRRVRVPETARPVMVPQPVRQPEAYVQPSPKLSTSPRNSRHTPRSYLATKEVGLCSIEALRGTGAPPPALRRSPGGTRKQYGSVGGLLPLLALLAALPPCEEDVPTLEPT